MLGKFIDWLRRSLEVRRGRIRLSELTDYELDDIGLNRADADLEVARPFWDYHSYKLSQRGRGPGGLPLTRSMISDLRAREEGR